MMAHIDNLENGSLRNTENLKCKKTADSVLLSLFMRTFGKYYNSHKPSTCLSGIMYCFKRYKVIGCVIVTFKDMKE